MQIIAYCSCGQSFSLDDSLLGTSMQCPTCYQFFVVQAAAPPTQQPFATNADHLQNRYAQPAGQEPLQQPAPPVAQTASAPHGQSELLPLSPLPDQPAQSSADQGTNTAASPAMSYRANPGKKGLWVGLGVGLGGAAVLILLLLLLIGQFVGGRSRALNLAYLPSSMSQFFFCDVEGLMDSQNGRSMVERGFLVKQYFAYLEKATRLDLSEIQTITVGYSGTDSTDTIRPFNLRSKRPLINFDLQSFISFCSVIRTKKDVQPSSIMEGLPTYTEKNHEGVSYYCEGSNPGHAFAFPEPRVILFGTEAEIRQALEGSSGTATSMFNSIRSSDHIVFINSMGRDFATGAEQTGIAVHFGDEVSGRLWVELPSAQQAQHLASAQREMQQMIRNLPDSPALRKARASGFSPERADPFGLGEVSVSGKILTTEFAGNDKLVTTATSQQAVVGMLRPFARFGNRDIGKAKPESETAKREPAKRQKTAPPKKKSSAKTIASLPRYTAGNGNKIDLLEIIDPKKDQIQGDWAFRNQLLVNGSNSFRPRFQIPYQPPEEYDIKISFRQSSPRGGISIMIPNEEGRSFSWVMDQAGRCRFTVSPIKKNATIIQIQRLVKPNVIHSLVIQKRRNLVRAVFDDRILAEYLGSWGDLMEDIRTRLKNRKLIGFACETMTSINQIELTEVRGTGSFVE